MRSSRHSKTRAIVTCYHRMPIILFVRVTRLYKQTNKPHSGFRRHKDNIDDYKLIKQGRPDIQRNIVTLYNDIANEENIKQDTESPGC